MTDRTNDSGAAPRRRPEPTLTVPEMLGAEWIHFPQAQACLERLIDHVETGRVG